MVSKWEQLSLAPDLLRSLSKFGVGPPNKIQQRALPFLLRGADIIAQAPPTQERIAAYVIPAIQVAVVNTIGRPPNRGPLAIMISTTVDQATQAQRMIRDLGGPIGIRSALGVGTTTAPSDLTQELRLLQQNMPHIICGTPQKLHALFTSPGGLTGSEVRFLVLDEVDQLIARNLHDFVFNIVKLLPPPRSRPLGTGTPGPNAGTGSQPPFGSFDGNGTPPLGASNTGRRFSAISTSPANDAVNSPSSPIERQTALFSNTVPQDVLNLATAIQLREPVRVLVRRDGNVTSADTSQGSRGLRQFYLYLAFTAGGRSEPMNSAAPGGGHGIIGSGRGASSAESAQAREWKLDALADIFDDVEVSQAIVHVGGMTALDSVVYKLASRGLEAVPLHGDMNAGTKLAALNKFRSSTSTSVIMRQSVTKVLVVNDVQVKIPEVSHVPLIINYDLPKAVEEYAHRVAPAIASSYARAGVIVNFVTATGGDVEMLRSIECFYKIKCPEVPMSLRDIV
ncbi:P-loop containing nucleoside triphosphate hydrolase protein [Leucogyrophana mollusca]|uniref:P-loop containing nucleoside triphosphate hydrolase protein n=1 Tax=Leucogyrophana mollusca TaxID=85980 RepID=A0ACB8BXA4_9AGAM|nr:P-loop containing nucleoside triphosphate hydrolase protein [Leucogyrophana mollusca]